MINNLIKVTRTHEFCAGHRVYQHEGKCRNLHGHGYKVEFTCSAPQLDSLGRIIDFSVMKDRLCQWLEDNWDHRMLLWEGDPLGEVLKYDTFPTKGENPQSVVLLPFNPTAENIAQFLLTIVGPAKLVNTGVTLTSVTVHETPKCSATVSLPTL